MKHKHIVCDNSAAVRYRPRDLTVASSCDRTYSQYGLISVTLRDGNETRVCGGDQLHFGQILRGLLPRKGRLPLLLTIDFIMVGNIPPIEGLGSSKCTKGSAAHVHNPLPMLRATNVIN